MAKKRDTQGAGKRPDRGLRPVQDIVGRIRFDPLLDVRRFSIGYEERFAGVREAPLADFIGEGEIPSHRIWYVKAGALVVWDRKERIDLVFGSGDSPVADLAAILKACEPEPVTAVAAAPKGKRKAAAEFVALPCFGFDVARGEWVVARPGPEVRVDALQVLTYNVLFDLYEVEKIYSEQRRAACRELLRAQAADIVALQEVTPTFWAELLATPWVRENYFISSGPDAGGLEPYGNALLSRWPLALEVHAFSEQKRLVLGRLPLAGRPLTVVAVHLTSNHKDDAQDKRAEQISVLGARLAREPGDALVLGDFNFGDGPENDHLTAVGLEDTWTLANPHNPGFTFDPLANPLAALMSRSGNAGRYDRILMRAPTRALTPVEVVQVGNRPFNSAEQYVSDHFGVCALLQVTDDSAMATVDVGSVHQSSLCLIPPEHAWGQIQAIRAGHDPSFVRWMPHINLVYGFVPETHFEAAAALVAGVVRDQPVIRVRFATLRRFDHRGSTTVWVEPECEPADALVVMQRRLAARFPGCVEQGGRSASGYNPHLTLAKLSGSEAEIAAQIAAWQAAWRPVEVQLDAVHLISRRDDDPFEIRRSLPFVVPRGIARVKPLPGDAAVRGESFAEIAGVVAPPPGARLPSERHTEVVAAVARACMTALGSDAPCLHIIGSARLGVTMVDSDVDLVCAGQAGRDELFAGVRDELAARGLLTNAREVGGAGLPVLRFRVGDVAVDLQYAQLPAGLAGESLADLEVGVLAELDEPSRRAALGCLDADAVLRYVAPNVDMEVFRGLLGRVRGWARARQLDVGAWGLLGSYTWALLAARSTQGADPRSDVNALLRGFFLKFAAWEPGRPVALGGVPEVQAVRRAPWPIYTPTPPAFNSARSLTRSTYALLQAELRRVHQVLDGALDEAMAAPIGAPAGPRVVLALHAADAEDRHACAGWLDGQVLGLLIALEREGATVRPYPRPVLVDGDTLQYSVGVDGGRGAGLLAAARRFVEGFDAWHQRPLAVTLRASLVGAR